LPDLLSRKTSRIIAETLVRRFKKRVAIRRRDEKMDFFALKDFLYDNGFEDWFLKKGTSTSPYRVKEFWMNLHTGASQEDMTAEGKRAGQAHILKLAECLLNLSQEPHSGLDCGEMQQDLDLDGYQFVGGKLLKSTDDVVPYEEELNLLQQFYRMSQLNPDKELEIFGYLESSRAAYTEKRWKDSIHNSRVFLESILQEVATKHHQIRHQSEIKKTILERPREVREYFLREDLIDEKEKEVLKHVYGLLSEKGSHPLQPLPEQARLTRNLSQTFSQFILNRLLSFQKKPAGGASS